MKEGCGEKCIIDCSKEFTKEVQSKIHEAYWRLPNMDEKRSYLTSPIVRSNVHRKRKRKEASKKDRSCSYEYWFPDPNETMNTQGYNIKVCANKCF